MFIVRLSDMDTLLCKVWDGVTSAVSRYRL